MQAIEADALDLRLLHALQIEPRASWAALAPVLGVDAATLSRRWRRLSEEGLAWVTGLTDLPGASGFALIDIECAPGRAGEAAAVLVEDPQVVILDHTAGGRDLFATVFADDQAGILDYTLHRFAGLPSVRSTRTHLVIDTIAEGGGWRLRELAGEQAARIPRPAAPRARAARSVPEDLTAVIAHELSVDGRTPAGEIGRRHGIPAQRVADAIATLRHAGRLTLRTDVARRVSSWPVYAWYFVEAPASTVARLRTSLAAVPEVRLAAITASRYNLILAVWLHDTASIHAFEVALERAAPGARIVDRSLVLRIEKHMGRILDADGRASGRTVPFVPAPG